MASLLKIRLPAVLEHLSRFTVPVVDCARDLGFPPARTSQVELALEEALVNIFSYAYVDGPQDVELTCDTDERGRLAIEIRDWGPPFDVLAAAPPDLESQMADRPIGGLGIHMIRRLMEEVHYRYENRQNILTLIVDRPAESSAEGS